MRTAMVFLGSVLLAACDGGAPSPPAASPAGPSAGASAVAPLVVYAPPVTADGLAPALAAYTTETGISVTPRFVDGLSELLAEGGDEPRADVAVFVGARAAALAAEEGLLRPVTGAVAAQVLPAGLRDPDGTWVALAWRPAAIARDVRAAALPVADDYAALAEPGFAGRVCVTAYDAGANAAIVADLIDALGVRTAERQVRLWLGNAGQPPLTNDAELVTAIVAGRCAAGIVLAPAGPEPDTGVLRYRVPEGPSGELWSAGVSRHASQPDAALALVAWLVTDAELPAAARDVAVDHLPARHPAVTGALGEEADRLAERAGYR